MIRLLTAILLLTFSHFGWAMAYPEDYSGVPHGNFKEGDVIDHTKFNQNNLSIKEAINDRVPVPSNCSTDQIIKYDGDGWVCADMPSGGGGSTGTMVWRDANGNLFPEQDDNAVLYRFPEFDKVFYVWNYLDNEYAGTTPWFNTPDCSGQPFTKLEDQSDSYKTGFRTSTHWLLPDFNASATTFSGTANNLSLINSSGDCETLTDDFSFEALPMIQSSAPLDLITPPIELIWE